MMIASNVIVCELKGIVHSNPVILKSHPLQIDNENSSIEEISKFLPFGSQAGDFIITKHKKNIILSYIFKIENYDRRDDLLSISIYIDKKVTIECYKDVLEKIISLLEESKLLKEEILIKNLDKIFDGIYEEKNIAIGDCIINFHALIKDFKNNYEKKKPNIKGSFI